MRIFPELEKGILNHVFGRFFALNVAISQAVKALGMAFDQQGKGLAATILDEREEFVVVFIRPGCRHSVELIALRL